MDAAKSCTHGSPTIVSSPPPVPSNMVACQAAVHQQPKQLAKLNVMPVPNATTLTNGSSTSMSSSVNGSSTMVAASTTSSTNAAKNGCGETRKWKSKNGERLRDQRGYRLRAAGVCARRNAASGELEMLLVSAQRGPHAWVIPGGGIERGEQMSEAVLREVEEEAGVRACVVEIIGEFQDDDRRHRTALYLLSPIDELEIWEDGMNGRQRQWLTYTEALDAVKITQRTMLELAAQCFAEIENTAISAR